ncbi:MAG: SUMF1/EgtB/PvdO family nonheme iron enzyme, partial [Myxococcales bacterium]|nr:SUMF1/EgtB/PvdO family nonheme iron enzyme [Myxococcales bacterium]
IARGGMGRIVSAEDPNLGRTVAMKLLLQGKAEHTGIQLRFTEEAQITGQLQHPNIVPVHELGLTPDGDLYFTMKRVNGRTLRDILRQIRRRDEVTVRTYTRSRLLNAFKQVCLGVAYAHSRGVVHRDLKPSNIMFGDFGEVLIMDWGLAKILPRALPGKVQSHRSGQSRWATRHGEVIGTPGYMPPELALGQLDDVDERADLYSLGAILYEIVTLRPTYTGRDARTILKKMLQEPLIPPSERAPELDVPPDIEAICLKCLAKPIKERYASALELHDAIEAFLEGALERDRRRAQGQQALDEARAHGEQYRALTRRVNGLAGQIAQIRAALPPWAGVERRRELWAAEENLDAARRDRTEAYTRAAQAYRHALEQDAELEAAREGLAQLYWQAFREAEQHKDRGNELHYEALLRDLLRAHPQPQFARRLAGDGALAVQTDPPGVRAVLFRVEPVDLVFTPVEPRDLGTTPVRLEPLAMGNYLLVLRAPGLREVQLPLRIGRLEQAEVEVKLYSDAHLGRSFVYVPGGRFELGGDPEAHWALPPGGRELPAFCIARLPVSCRQYQDFLDALATQDLDEARRRRPRLFAQGGFLFEERDGRFYIPDADPSGNPWDPNWPVMGVSAQDAEAYCAWRSQVDGVIYRLPTEFEWEAAARGADGRPFVWGERWEPTYCNCAHSRAHAASLEPCGSFPTDRSPYGVLDLAGGVADWTSTPVADGHERIIRGGSYNQLELYARAASRQAAPQDSVALHVGFRLARDP